jgi:hypothetical protein
MADSYRYGAQIERKPYRFSGYKLSPTERFWRSFEEDEATGCWVWTASRNAFDYGRISVNGKFVKAHRFAYELLVGPIPDGLVLDHLCRNHPCVNPGHLEPVTSRENTLRGETIPAANIAKTHCSNGHPFNDENTLIEGTGKRKCMVCDRQYKQTHKAEARDLSQRQLVVLEAVAGNAPSSDLRPAARGQIESSLRKRGLLKDGAIPSLTPWGREVLEREAAEIELRRYAFSQPTVDYGFEDLAEFTPYRAEDCRERALTRMEVDRDPNADVHDRYAGTVWE